LRWLYSTNIFWGDSEMNVSEAKKDLAIKTKRGLPVILAGILFWIVVSITGFVLSEKQVCGYI
jgi:hypothetical protein